jgi:hypothetical protein
MKRAVVSLAALTFALTVGLQAQGAANFAGTWKLNMEKSEMGGGGRGGRGGGMPGDMVIKQTATELSVTRGENTTVYKLDGSEVTIPGPRGEAKAKARAEGATIVIETTRSMGENTITTTSTWSMEGDNLVISSVSATPMGERKTKMVYDKAS